MTEYVIVVRVYRRVLVKQSTRCRLVCFQMPISGDVDGFLFELLLLKPTPSLPGEKRPSGQNETLENRHCHRRPTLKVLEDSKQEMGIISADGGSAVETRNGVDGACQAVSGGVSGSTLVGAVALLLWEVAHRWRTMESPLFDSSGSVVGTIKMAARILGRGDRKAGHALSLECSVGASRKGAMGHPPEGETEMADGASPGQVVRDCRLVQDSMQTPACCNHGDGSRFASPAGPESWGNTSGTGLPGTETAVLEERPLTRECETTPRAEIIYRGIRLPYRWFRSSSAASMNEALRETLGG